jgi:hypothetical protein
MNTNTKRKQIAVMGVALLFAIAAAAAADDALLASNTAGPLHFGAWGKSIWAPLVYKGDADGEADGRAGAGPGLGVGSGPGWDSIGAAVGFEVWGSNREESGGFEIKLRVKSDGGSIYANDNTANLWVKPFDMLAMKFGMYQFDDFRGTIGGISEIAGGYGGDEDTIFQRCESDGFGALFILNAPETAPAFLKPLKVFASFGVTGELDTGSGEFAALTPNGLSYIFAAPHAGIGYDFENIGFLRAQFIGTNYKWGHGDDWYHNGTFWFPSHVRESARLEAAFNLTAVKNLKLDVGGGIPFSVTVMKDDTGTAKSVGPTYGDLGVISGSRRDYKIAASEGDVYHPPVIIAAGAEYSLGNIGLKGRFKMSFGERVVFDSGDADFTGGLDIEVGFEPSYTFSFGALIADVAIRINGNDTFESNETISHNGSIDLGLGAWFTKEIGSSVSLKCGVGANVPVWGDGYFWTPNGTKAQKEEKEAYMRSKLIVAVPFILTVSLF